MFFPRNCPTQHLALIFSRLYVRPFRGERGQSGRLPDMLPARVFLSVWLMS